MAHAVTMRPRLSDLIGTWGWPPDIVSKAALSLACVALLVGVMGRGRVLLGVDEPSATRRTFLWASAFAAALLSVAYIASYLRGGPRIIDATTYFLQGRGLSHGDWNWPVPEPSASFRGRFLLYQEESGAIGGIFPPGYPLLLAVGFLLGAPMVVGPALAAGLVVATYRLARTIASDVFGVNSVSVEPVARTAALVSIACAALRYHTADTMAHGATALGITVALNATFHKRAWLAGLAVGAVFATRPVSAIAPFLVAAAIFFRRTQPRQVGLLALCMLPGIAVFLAGQHAVTGQWWTSSQKMYYTLSDGPPGCFRFGFGHATGCIFEHGDFVEARLHDGYGLVEALGTTLRRVRMHLLDIGNLEPLALLVLLPVVHACKKGTRHPTILAAASLVAIHIVSYAGFYFDGNYPGGGARLFADILPVEHALVGIALLQVGGARHLLRSAFTGFALVLGGFAIHGVFEHLRLANRDGGRPMFEPDVLARANVSKGLVFVDTDHGFGLGHDPGTDVTRGIVVARLRHDDRDRTLFEELGEPPTFLYKFEIPLVVGAGPPPRATPLVVPWVPPPIEELARFEAEAEWPVLSQTGGFAVPAYCDACASESRALALTPSPIESQALARVAIPVRETGRYIVTVRTVSGVLIPHHRGHRGTSPKGTIEVSGQRWEWTDAGTGCSDLPPREVLLTAPFATLQISARDGTVALDRVSLERVR